MDGTDWAAVSAVAAVLALSAAVGVYLAQRQRDDFALACQLHADLTGGEVAQAREALGTLVHDSKRIGDDDLARVRTSYFALLWCFERIEAGRRSMTAGMKVGNRPVAFLDEVIGWQVEYWHKNFPVVKAELERRIGVPVSDDRSRAAFDRLSRVLVRQSSPTGGAKEGHTA
ncbi:hypothetical protein G4Z16_09330 [Streptomyces bathyalis]|uniref:DUF4760 domain-containing protein n=1 Tax=Streptomyces bathyalis TaxID=2710756 RepID=A0A7T1T539_9ACTN|nr:hypothetical protein [Streptomyces bathyalis]QPP06569.1 hypothetical protein G4Z16_09330 [Streptomyces bathyalis]